MFALNLIMKKISVSSRIAQPVSWFNKVVDDVVYKLTYITTVHMCPRVASLFLDCLDEPAELIIPRLAKKKRLCFDQ